MRRAGDSVGRSVEMLVICGLVAGACSSGPPPPDTSAGVSYVGQVQADRRAKDEFFRIGQDSPLSAADRASFEGLPYYPVSPAYRVPASLEPDPDAGARIIRIPTSQDTFDQLRVVGTLRFSLSGEPFALTAFASVDSRTIERLFVPFGDLTNPDETYGGGRYLDLDRTPTGLYDLDFNRAYHPTCVYNIAYVCPRPPPENHLDVAIRAGERLPDAAGTPDAFR